LSGTKLEAKMDLNLGLLASNPVFFLNGVLRRSSTGTKRYLNKKLLLISPSNFK
jgi:hypothetical protein